MKRNLILIMMLAMMYSCEYKDLCYDHNHGQDTNCVLKLQLQLDVDVDFPVDVEDHTAIIPPEYMKVDFYSPETGAIIKTEYIQGSEGPIQINPGTYNMVVYNFGTEWTQIRGEDDINTLEAFTSDITMTKAAALASFTRSGEYEAPGPIIYTPDHLLVARKQVEIPAFTEETQVITVTANAATIMETYSFELPNVTGAEYISSAEAFVTNQARGNYFGRGELVAQPATLSFPVEVDKERRGLHTTFNTFGKLPGESHSYLHILIIDTEGEEYQISSDITDQFDNEDHRIIIEDPVDIPPPEAGGNGITPTVDPWDEENHDVPIG